MPGEQRGSEYKGPGPVLYSRGKKNRTKQNQVRLDQSYISCNYLSTMVIYSNLLIYIEQEAICLEDCCIGDKYIFLIFLPIL